MAEPKLDLNSVLSTAYHLTKLGYFCVPIGAGRKSPILSGWQQMRIPLRDIESYFNPATDTGVGLMTGELRTGLHIVGLDVDVDDDLLLERIRRAIGGTNIPAKRGRKGLTFILRSPTFIKSTVLSRRDPVIGSKINAIDVLGSGKQTVIPPTIHPDTDQPYQWIGTPLTEVTPDDLPELTAEVFQEIKLAVQKPESVVFSINTMLWAGRGGGGDVHNSCLSASGALIAMGWSDDAVWSRIQRATLEACNLSGSEYDEADWPTWENEVRNDMIAPARDKGFADGKKENPHLLAARWFASNWRGSGAVRQRDGLAMVYSDGWYETYTEPMIRHVIATQYPEPKNVSFIHNNWVTIARTISDIVQPFEPDASSHRVCLRNGTFDMNTGEFGPHSPDDFLIAQLPFSYDPEARCPNYEHLITYTFDDEDPSEMRKSIDTFEEFTALTLFEDLSFQKFLVLKGPTNSGKSTLLHVIRMLHSEKAVSAIGTHNWGNERYQAHMVNKLVNLTGEVATVSHTSDDFLKMVTAGDPCSVRMLYREPFDVVLPVRLVIACNDLFHTRDTSGAIERRMIILQCVHQVPEGEVDTSLWTKLRSERAGVFNRIVQAWPRLRDRRIFLPPESSRKLIGEFSLEQNHPGQWLTDCTHQGAAANDPEHRMPPDLKPTESNLLFVHYCEWAKLQGYRPISSVTWGTKLQQAAKSLGIDVTSRNVRIGGTQIKARLLNLLNPPSF